MAALGPVLLAARMALAAAAGAVGRQSTSAARRGRAAGCGEGQIWSGSASRINLRKRGVLGDGIEFGLVDHHAARAGRRHLIYGESHRLNASKSGLFRVQCKMNFSREGAAE